MENRREERLKAKETTLQKKLNRADNNYVATAMISGITAGFATVAALLGGASAITADAVMVHTAQGIYEQDDFQASVRDRARQLTDDLVNGKISYNEFKSAYEKLYTKEEVIEYSKTANNEELTSVVEDYHEAKDMTDTMFSKAIPAFLGTSLASVGVMSVTGAIRRKYEQKLVALQNQMAEEEMGK